MVLRTKEEIKAISDPYRLRIMRIISNSEQGLTASQVAERMQEVPSKVYYHIKKLEKVGLLEVCNTEVINGIIAKYYRRTAERFTIEEEHDDEDNPLMTNEAYKTIKSVYDESLSIIKEVITDKDNSKKKPMIFSATDIYITEEERLELIEYIKRLKGKKKPGEGKESTHILFSII